MNALKNISFVLMMVNVALAVLNTYRGEPSWAALFIGWAIFLKLELRSLK
jgi:hypothetical protein